MSRSPAAVLTVRDAQILQLLREGVSRDRVLAIGVHRRSWTADDVQHVITHWLPDGRPRPLRAVPDDGQATIPPPRTPGQHTPGLRDLVIDLLSDPVVVAKLRAALQPDPPPERDRTQGRVLIASPRVREVAAGICDGLANKEIGTRLHISEDTVKTYMRQLFDILGVRDRTSAAVLLTSGQVRLAASGDAS